MECANPEGYEERLIELNAVVNGRVNQSNSVSLQTRVKEIINELPADSRKLITRDTDDFAKKVVKARDALTHYVPDAEESLKGAELYNTVIGLRILLTLLLLRELGIEERVSEQAVAHNDRFLNPWYSEVAYESTQPSGNTEPVVPEANAGDTPHTS